MKSELLTRTGRLAPLDIIRQLVPKYPLSPDMRSDADTPSIRIR